MKYLFGLALLTFCFFGNAQEIEPDYAKQHGLSKQDSVINFSIVEKIPLVPGCDTTAANNNENGRNCFQSYVIQHVAKNFKYPSKAIKLNVQAIIYVSFVVEKDGKINAIEIPRGAESKYSKGTRKQQKAAKLLDKEAVRVVKKLKFLSPAIQRGKPVRMSFTIPINAKL